ncbi:MAG: FdhF/YdeP family oxidoreductase [Solirubrobacteraceae bacterium]
MSGKSAHGEKIHTEPPKKNSVGVPGLVETARYAETEMGAKRSLQTLPRMNQHMGFDCPSCAWPEPAERKTAEFCENGAKAVAWEATRKRVGPDFFAAHSVEDLRTRDSHWLEENGRLTTPMYLAPGATHYTPIDWDGALTLIADRLKALENPNRAVFYTSGRASNEAAFTFQLLARRFGTNNLPDCSNMCHESTGAALSETIGIGKGCVTIEDLSDFADLIVIVGQNPGTNHPRMLTTLERAKLRGAKIVSINPLPEAGMSRFHNPQTIRGMTVGTQLGDRYLPVRVNGDLALFAAVNKALLEREEAAPGTVFDHDFIDTYCDGFEAACEGWRALDWATLEADSGLRRAQIDDFVRMVLDAHAVTVCWAMGLTQHRNGVPTIRELVNFLLLRGNIGRPGAGPSPIRGHSNVQGDRTMGIWEKMPPWFLDAIEQEFGFAPPREPGWDTVDTVRALRDEKVDVFFALGGNFVLATSDTAVCEAGMQKCKLTVNISTKLNRAHLCHGTESLILPCLGRTERDTRASGEQFVTVEDSMSMVHASLGRLKPGSPELRSEVAILTGVAEKLFGASDGKIQWRAMGDDYSLIRKHIEHVVPGFHSYEERAQTPRGFMLPRGPHDSRTFKTATGKARFTVNPLTRVEVPEGHLLLQTVRAHDQFNTTIYGFDDRYRGISGGRDVVFVNPTDLAARGLTDGDLVDIINSTDSGERRCRAFRAVSYPTPPGCVAAYFPEANMLVPLESVAEVSNTPASKSVVVRLERAARPTAHEASAPALA